MTKKTKLFAGILAAVLLVVALDVKLAQPERHQRQQDNFIGFFLAYEPAPQPGSEIETDRSHWEEYGSESMHIDGLGSVNFPTYILKAERDGDQYTFPGMEGYNCFLAYYTDEYGEQYTRGYEDMAECEVHINETDSISHILSGTVYFGPPLDDSSWNTENFDYMWTAYRVYQMEDETVYIDGTGNSYGGVGGFGFSEKSERTTTINGERTTESLKVSVQIDSIHRLETVTIQQYDNNDQLLRTDVLTAEQAAALNGGALELILEETTAYAVVIETDVEGNSQREIRNVLVSGSRTLYFDTWFLKDNGMGYCVPVRLDLEKEEETPSWMGL